MTENLKRVIYYSNEDLSAINNLKEAEKLINHFDENKLFSLNDILELYNIQLYFDNNLRLNNWSDEIYNEYKNTIKKFEEIIKTFFLLIDNSNIDNYLIDIDYSYTKCFLKLFNKFNIFKKIDFNILAKLIATRKFIFEEILTNQEITNYYSKQLTIHFENNPDTAEIILSYYEENSLRKKEKIFLPKAFNLEKIELLINNYISIEQPNLNYLNLIINAKNLKLSDKTKFKASKKEREITKSYFDKNTGTSYGLKVEISKEQLNSKKADYDEAKNELIYTYSAEYLDSTKDSYSIFKNFSYLFEYINLQGCINLVSRNSEIDTMETIFMRSKGEHLRYHKFIQKEFLSNAQLIVYKYYLKNKKIEIEEVLKFIVQDVFKTIYEIDNLKISFPSKQTEYFEKVRILAPELEFLLKQYQAFVKDGEIDFELLQYNSSALYFSKIESKLNIKYVYGINNEFLKIKNCLFSSQASLAYIEPYKSKYQNLHNLLSNENVKYDSFENFQKKGIDFLIEKEIIFYDNDSNLKVNNIMSIIFGCLFHQEVISFWHFQIPIRKKLIELEKKKIIEFDNLLFTREEISYFNYNLNKKEHTNGLDLRNKYSHGSNSHSAEIQESDYNVILKILILILLKIEDDIILTKQNS